MPAQLLELIRTRRAALRFYEWEEELRETELRPATLESFGSYLLARAPAPDQLWDAFAQALAAKKSLVVIGPMSAEAETILLRQLPKATPAEAVLALFTSGSTGQPKAVFHQAGSLLASAEQLATGLGAPLSQCSLLPASGMAGIAFHLLLPLFAGKNILLWRQPALESAGELPLALKAACTDLLSLNPFLLEMVLRNERFGEKKLDVVSLTSPLREKHRAEFRQRCPGFLREIYGMTEFAGPVLLDGVSLGPQTRLEENELLLRSPTGFSAYAQEGSVTPAPDWFPTGDIFRSEKNRWCFVSRKKELLDFGGRKVAPALIEEIFLALPEVRECLAFGIQVQGVERTGLLYVRAGGSEEAVAEKISERARTSLSLDMRPFVWREVVQLPRLPNGKVSRQKAVEILSGEKGDISPVSLSPLRP